VSDVSLVLVLGVAADLGDVASLLRVVEVRQARVIELEIGAAERREPAELLGVGGTQVLPERV
jgi:hypothetical protein